MSFYKVVHMPDDNPDYPYFIVPFVGEPRQEQHFAVAGHRSDYIGPSMEKLEANRIVIAVNLLEALHANGQQIAPVDDDNLEKAAMQQKLCEAALVAYTLCIATQDDEESDAD